MHFKVALLFAGSKSNTPMCIYTLQSAASLVPEFKNISTETVNWNEKKQYVKTKKHGAHVSSPAVVSYHPGV